MKRQFYYRYYTVDEVATHLGVSQRTVRRWYTFEKLPYVKIGRMVRLYGPDVNRFLELDDLSAIFAGATPRHRPVVRRSAVRREAGQG